MDNLLFVCNCAENSPGPDVGLLAPSAAVSKKNVSSTSSG